MRPPQAGLLTAGIVGALLHAPVGVGAQTWLDLAHPDAPHAITWARFDEHASGLLDAVTGPQFAPRSRMHVERSRERQDAPFERVESAPRRVKPLGIGHGQAGRRAIQAGS